LDYDETIVNNMSLIALPLRLSHPNKQGPRKA